MQKKIFITLLLGIVLLFAGCTPETKTEPLPSWHEGEAKQSIMDFVDQVTRRSSPDFVPAAERVAVFDNDGTLWSEQLRRVPIVEAHCG
jgi:hypothetical protein